MALQKDGVSWLVDWMAQKEQQRIETQLPVKTVFVQSVYIGLAMTNVVKWILAILIICVSIYGIYWLAKTGSYFFFYESMVQDTIREMVKPEYLINTPEE